MFASQAAPSSVRPFSARRTSCPRAPAVRLCGPARAFPGLGGGGGGGGAGGAGGRSGGGGGGSGGEGGGAGRKACLSLGVLGLSCTLAQPSHAHVAKSPEKKEGLLVRAERFFEHALLSSRFLVLTAVVGAILMAAGMFFKGLQTVFKALRLLLVGRSSELSIKAIESLDEFLTGCASLVFGMGLFDLFISKLDLDEDADAASQTKKGVFNKSHRPEWLALNDLGELKHRTGAVVIFLFVVRIIEAASKIPVRSTTDLLLMGGTALLSSMSVSLMGIDFNGKAKEKEKEEEEE